MTKGAPQGKASGKRNKKYQIQRWGGEDDKANSWRQFPILFLALALSFLFQVILLALLVSFLSL